MQLFKIFIFAALITILNACAPTQTVTSPPTTTTVKTVRKRRSTSENKNAIIKITFNVKNQVKAHQLEGLFLDKLYSSTPVASSILDKVTRFTSIENDKLATIMTISESFNNCPKIINSIKDIFEGNNFVKDVTIKCGDEKAVSVFNYP